MDNKEIEYLKDENGNPVMCKYFKYNSKTDTVIWCDEYAFCYGITPDGCHIPSCKKHQKELSKVNAYIN